MEESVVGLVFRLGGHTPEDLGLMDKEDLEDWVVLIMDMLLMGMGMNTMRTDIR